MPKKNTYFQDEVIRKKFDIRQFGRVLRYMKPYRGSFILVGILMLVSAGLAMITPLLLREIIDNVVVTEEYRTLAFVIASMATIAILEIGVNFFHQRIMGIVGHRII